MGNDSFISTLRSLADKYHRDDERYKREQLMCHRYIGHINDIMSNAAEHGKYAITYEIHKNEKDGEVNFDTVVNDIVSYYKNQKFDVIQMEIPTYFENREKARISISWKRKEIENDEGNTTQNEKNISNIDY